MTPPLPWLGPTRDRLRALGGAHAVLLAGALGDGLFEAALDTAASWLCESDAALAPCGHCPACRLLQSRAHPDLHRLLPEDLRRQVEPESAPEEAADGESRKGRKPSRQIRIDDVRRAIDWAATTSSRGRGKVVLIHPADTMNVQAASALLKTLEEPPRGVRLLLSSPLPDRLLPTVRSRCQMVRLAPVDPASARDWLAGQGVREPEVLLAACGGRPLEVLAMAAAGIDAGQWVAVPGAVISGQAAAMGSWPLARVLDALLKLCHDGMALAAGGTPRFFPPQGLRPPRSLAALAAWQRELIDLARRIDHPWNEALMLEALLRKARSAWLGEPRHGDTLAA